MKFWQYLESSYVSKNLDLQKQYSPWIMAQTRAAQNLINAQRRVFIWAAYFVFPILFILIKFGLMEEPMTAKELAEAIKTKKPEEEIKTENPQQ